MEITEMTIAEQVYLFENDSRTQEQKYQAIVESIKQIYKGKKELSDQELREAANRVIEFVKTILEISERLQKK